MEDVLMWPFTPTGSYTVKFGYRFLYNSRSLDNRDYQLDDNRLWKKVWGMQVQPKVRNFLWRAIRNSIPTKQNLKQRMVLTDDGCDHCHGEPENVLLALWLCPPFLWFGLRITCGITWTQPTFLLFQRFGGNYHWNREGPKLVCHNNLGNPVQTKHDENKWETCTYATSALWNAEGKISVYLS